LHLEADSGAIVKELRIHSSRKEKGSRGRDLKGVPPEDRNNSEDV
jgi:hypothetical protein